jgi:hypothetical protein
MNATVTAKRIISSTWQGSDLDATIYTGDGDYQDLLEETIQREGRYGTHRESFTMGDGRKEYRAYVTDYTDPATGEKRYAACYEEPAGTEYIDFPTLAEAEAEYEQNVRGLQSCVEGQVDEDGEPQCWFETTDVEA